MPAFGRSPRLERCRPQAAAGPSSYAREKIYGPPHDRARDRARGSAILAEADLGRRQARLLLKTGVAGHGKRPGAVVLYEAARVRDLAGWPVLTPGQIQAACPFGVLVGRFAADRVPDVDDLTDGVLTAARGSWDLPGWPTLFCLAMVTYRQIRVPFLATMSGFVLAGAEIAGVAEAGLRLEPPGRWFDAVRRHRMPRGQGGQGVRMWWPAPLLAEEAGTDPRPRPRGRPLQQ